MDISFLGNIFKIVGGVIALLNFVGIIFVYVVNRTAYTKITTNHIHHLDLKLDDLKKSQDELQKSVQHLSQVVFITKGQFDSIFTLLKERV